MKNKQCEYCENIMFPSYYKLHQKRCNIKTTFNMKKSDILHLIAHNKDFVSQKSQTDFSKKMEGIKNISYSLYHIHIL